MSASPEIYPTDTVLVVAPRAYEAEVRARVPRPLVVLSTEPGRIVVAHDAPVYYAFDFDDERVLRKLLITLADDSALLVDDAHGVSLQGDAFVRAILHGAHSDWRKAAPARFRSKAAADSIEAIVGNWLTAKGPDGEPAVELERLGDVAFAKLAAFLQTGILSSAKQIEALGMLRRLGYQSIARRDEFRAIAREIAARTEDESVRSRAVAFVTTGGPLHGADDDERTLEVLRDVIDKDLQPGARERALAFLDRFSQRDHDVRPDVDAGSPLDALERSIAALLRERDATNSVSIARRYGTDDRLFLLRVLGDRNRSVSIAALEPNSDVAWDFGLFVSEDSRVPSFAGAEGRKFGSAEYALHIVRLWLLEWVLWNELPSLETGAGPIDWQLAYRQYRDAARISRHEQLMVLSRLATRLPKDRESPYAGAITALRDPERKWFIADLLRRANRVPRTLLKPMVLAGIAEPDASRNERFIGPAAKTDRDYTADLVTTALVEGDEATKAGAVSALYWVEASRASDACRARCRERLDRALHDPNTPENVRADLRRLMGAGA